VLAGLALVVTVLGRRRLTLFDLAALVFTFAGAVLAIRGIPWFALTCMVLLPVAMGARLERKTPLPRRAVNGGIAFGAVALLAVVVVAALARGDSWYLKNWPEEAIAAVEEPARTPSVRVFATSRDADWVLWRIPELRGRLGYDVRFEIYAPDTFERIVRFRGEQGEDWKSLADGYEVVVLETEQEPSSHVADFLSEPGARELYGDDRVTVVLRQPGP
jgi:hypothetical protein